MEQWNKTKCNSTHSCTCSGFSISLNWKGSKSAGVQGERDKLSLFLFELHDFSNIATKLGGRFM